MKIHTNHPAEVESAIHEAAGRLAKLTDGRVRVVAVSPHGSRSRACRLDVDLAGSNRSGGAYGTLDYRTATWDEWGVVLGAIFAVDPDAIAGPYPGAEAFAWATAGRYDDGEIPSDLHVKHRWKHEGYVVTNRYHVSTCSGCSATTRATAYGVTLADLGIEVAR